MYMIRSVPFGTYDIFVLKLNFLVIFDLWNVLNNRMEFTNEMLLTAHTHTHIAITRQQRNRKYY